MALHTFWNSCTEYHFCTKMVDAEQDRHTCTLTTAQVLRKHALLGAYIELNDNGQVYNDVLARYKNKKRFSSHLSHAQQLYVEGPSSQLYAHSPGNDKGPSSWVHVLIGKTRTSSGWRTWFQMEHSPLRTNHKDASALFFLFELHNIIKHSRSFLSYKLTNKQKGVVGSSDNTDKFPIHCAKTKTQCEEARKSQ